MSQSSERQRARRHLTETTNVAGELTDSILGELQQIRDDIDTRDGLSGRRYDGSNRSGSSAGGPTPAVVMRKCRDDGSWRLVGTEGFINDVAEVFSQIAEVGGIMRSVHRKVDRILHISALVERGRVSSLAGECGACRRVVAGTAADPFRHGYCNRCGQAWADQGHPDRHRFEVDRRAQLNEDEKG